MDLDRRASFLLPLCLVGCRKTRNPEAVSREFMDRYYIEKNHSEALAVSTGAAAARVSSEQKLLAEAGTHPGAQPRVFYRLQKSVDREGVTELTYGLTIENAGLKLKKEVQLLVRKEGEDYKVSSFQERDLPVTE